MCCASMQDSKEVVVRVGALCRHARLRAEGGGSEGGHAA